MAKSRPLPTTHLILGDGITQAQWPEISRAFFKTQSEVVKSRYRWISRLNRDQTVKDYVLEDQGEMALVSCRYAPNLYVRAAIHELNDPNHAAGIYTLIKENQWGNVRLRQVLVRVGDRTVPVEALVYNESHRHRFTPAEVMDLIGRLQAEADWFLAKERRRRQLVTLGWPEPTQAQSVTQALDGLCRKKSLWLPQEGAVYRSYAMDHTTGELSLLECDNAGDLTVTTVDTELPPFLNPVALYMYEKYLNDQPSTESVEGRLDSLYLVNTFYRTQLDEMQTTLVSPEWT